MRTSHLKMRHDIENEKSKITEKEFFTSVAFRGYLADLAEATGNRYKKPIRIKTDWDENSSKSAAYTNNSLIYINSANRITASFPTLLLKLASIIGLLAHELGHILFTDFKKLALLMDCINKSVFYPCIPIPNTKPEETALDEILSGPFQECNKLALNLIATTTHSIMNRLEDVYVDARMCHRFPGDYKNGIIMITDRELEQVPTLMELLSGESKPLSVILSLLHQYALCGEINNPDGLENEYTQALDCCMSYIDDAIYDEDANVRLKNTNLIVLNIWPFIKKAIEEINDAEKTGGSDAGESQANDFIKQLEQLTGQTGGIPTGMNKPAPAESEDLPSKQKLRAATPQRKTCETKPVNTDKAPGITQDPSQVPVEVEPLVGEFESTKDDNPQDIYGYETDRTPLEETDDIDMDGDGGIEHNLDYAGANYESTASDIERLLESIATERVIDAYEKDLSVELQTHADKIRYGNSHIGVKVVVNRMTHVNDSLIEDYNKIAPPLLLLSKRLQKAVMPIIANKRDGGKQSGLFFGKRLSARESFRQDRRMFYNTRLPSEPIQMAVAVLCDESGSMGICDRATVTRAASIVLYDFCRGLNIPVAIHGHSTDHKDVQIYAHADFNSIDNNDKYRIMDITARCDNRDGAALRFTAEQLLKRPEPLKLLFLISDGQPYATGYYGTEAEADLRGIKLEYTRKGIKLIAAAIGDDKPHIERIYKDGFLDITNLNNLPMNLCTLLSRYVRESM